MRKRVDENEQVNLKGKEGVQAQQEGRVQGRQEGDKDDEEEKERDEAPENAREKEKQEERFRHAGRGHSPCTSWLCQNAAAPSPSGYRPVSFLIVASKP